MKYVYKLYIPFFFMSAVSIFLLQKNQIRIPPFISNYANDFLCLPLVLFICRSVIRKVRNEPHFEIPLAAMLLLALLYAFYFEWYLPKINARYTSDYIDGILYVAGAFLFYFLEKFKKISDHTKTDHPIDKRSFIDIETH